MIAALVAAPAFSISRADLLRGAGVASAVTLLPPTAANALSLEPADNEIVPYQVLRPCNALAALVACVSTFDNMFDPSPSGAAPQ